MAQNSQFKVNQIAKDLNMKGKEIVDILAGKGFSVTAQKSLDAPEFDALFDTLTRQNQINGIEDYLDGITYIPSSKKATVKAEDKSSPESVKAEPAEDTVNKPTAEATDAPVHSTKTEPQKSEKKTEPEAKKPEPANQSVPEAKNTETSNQAETEPKNTETAKQAEPTEVAAKTGATADTASAPKAKETVPQPAVQPKTAPQGTGNTKNTSRQPQQGDFVSKQPQQQSGNAGFSRPQQGGASARPQQNGYAPRSQQNNGGFAPRQPQQNGYAPRSQQNNGGSAPRQPQQSGFSPRSQQQGFGGAQGGGSGNGYGGRPSNGGYGQQRQSQHRGGNQFGNKDSEGVRVGGLKDTFKPQPIVRSQTQKGESNTQKGATRVVDMRGTTVDLSKYDEKLDTFVPDSVADVRGGNQRLKKQTPGRQTPTWKGRQQKGKSGESTASVTKAPTSVTIPDEILVSDLASRLKVTAASVVKKLMMLGMMVTVNQTIDYDTAAIVADELGIAATKEVVVTIEEKLFDETEDDKGELVSRAPVVCVMGHVDHGKTSILDAIRHTNVTTGEAGGITQHIGAYRVKVKGHDITFLDTPGHEAFTAMRARGAQATDIAVLVVAADDGIMPQTIEAINHAKAAGIDIIVAINKMDKPTANPDNVKQELTKYDLVPEEWGGDVICVPVSALTKQGIDDLLENILLVAEVKELKANPKRRAKGIVIEAKLDKGRGPVATVLVQNGTLHNGDIVIAGTAVGRVRAMTDHNGKPLKEAAPSVPVEIIGLSDVPIAGDEFNAVEDERMARTLADQRRSKAKEEVFKANARANLNDLFAQISDGVKELNIIVKADVDGSVEAVRQSLEKISNEEVKVRVIHAAVGGIREGDVMLAAASNAIIVGFNVRPDKAAIDSAERQNVEIRTYRVIYDCINEITDAMKGMLAPKYRENLLGHAEVRQTIHVPNVGMIAGSYVLDGKVTRSSMIRVVRDGVVIFEDKISSLRRFKDDVREVAQGYECGIGLERFNDIKVGDVLEAYIMEEIER